MHRWKKAGKQETKNFPISGDKGAEKIKNILFRIQKYITTKSIELSSHIFLIGTIARPSGLCYQFYFHGHRAIILHFCIYFELKKSHFLVHEILHFTHRPICVGCPFYTNYHCGLPHLRIRNMRM